MSNTGGPAFPGATYEGPFAGMTLRDYFAAKAMLGMLAHHGAVQNKKQAEDDAAGAARAYAIADAMLAAREQK